MGIEKEIINTDVSLNFTQIFLKFKEKPEAHMLPDVNYRKGVMTSKGIRPDTKRFPIATTKQLMCHGVFAMMVDTLKEYAAKERKIPKYIDLYERSQKVFDREKLHRQKLVYDIATGKKNNKDNIDIPKRSKSSVLDSSLFMNNSIVKIATLIDIIVNGEHVETSADVNINSINNKHLLYFTDYDGKTIYAVSHNGIPVCGDNKQSLVFNSLEQAYKYWKE